MLVAAVALAWASPAWTDAAEHCGGEYAEAAALVDAALGKYGTLYSGGNHWAALDDVGATLDLYRFWRGYPDIELRRFEHAYGYPQDDGVYARFWSSRRIRRESLPAAEVWDKARWALAPDAPSDAPDEDKQWAAVGLDLLTAIGPTPDWWRRADEADDLTAWRTWLAEMARTEPALDWLETVLVASDAPWADHRHLADGASPAVVNAYKRLADAAFARFQAGEGVEWLAAAAVADPDLRRNAPLRRALQDARRAVERCDADPRVYAAYAVGVAAGPADALDAAALAPLPETVRAKAAAEKLYAFILQELARRALGYAPPDPERRAADIAELRALAPDDAAWGRQVDLAELYLADGLDAVPLSDAPYARRAYNLLSTDDITRLARRDGGDPALTRAAFARRVALEDWDGAEALLPDLRAAGPENAATLDRIIELKAPQSTRLALIALEIPGVSVVIAAGDPSADIALNLHEAVAAGTRNLPDDYARGAILQRDFETWLVLPQRWRAYRHMRGYSLSWLARRYDRRRADLSASLVTPYSPFRRGTRSAVLAPQLVADGPSRRGAPFADLIAWEEIARLGGDARLTDVITREVVAWADARTDGRWERALGDHAAEADALAAVVRMCRREGCGAIDGAPAQQRAFELLHLRLPYASAAAATPYWWDGPKQR